LDSLELLADKRIRATFLLNPFAYEELASFSAWGIK
jgi:hypothetical protein